jgi:hypothetical protein
MAARARALGRTQAAGQAADSTTRAPGKAPCSSEGSRVIGYIGALLQITIATTPPPPAHPPFALGETLEYKASAGIMGGGTAVLRVAGIDTVRGVPSWRFTFTPILTGGFGAYKSNSTFTSWTGIADFVSRRFLKDVNDNGTPRRDDHLIYPDSGFFRDNNYNETVKTAKTPLDDVAFFYFIRYIKLEVGKTYVFQNYFNATKGDVTIKVLKRETMTLPDKSKVTCLVLYPIVEDPPNGMFLKRAFSKVWVTDDARRIPVQIQANTNWSTVTFKLVKLTEGQFSK